MGYNRRVRTSLALAFALSACAAPAPVNPPPPARCPNVATDISRMGPEVRTVSFVFHVDAPSCKKHPEPRVLRLEVDSELVREVSIPCDGPDDAGRMVMMFPDPGIDVEPFVVTDGRHHFTVIDPVTHDEDVEIATVPHVELVADGLIVGNQFEVVESDGALRIRGPVAMRMPRL